MSEIKACSRDQVRRQARALIKMCEGPGEIDSLVAEACFELAKISTLMRYTHERWEKEQGEMERKGLQRMGARKEIPKILLRKQLAALVRDDPNALRAIAQEYGVRI